MNEEKNWIKIEREFNAPIGTIWDMWTDPALFSAWYGPRGMSVPVAEMDVVVGGTRKVCMEMKSAERHMKMWFTGVYKEVTRPHRLVYTESMCNEDGTLITPQAMGMPDDFPDITEIIVELSEVNGKTLMTMVHIGVEAGTAGAGGWNQAFDKLAEYLSAREVS
ncbi:SRPBCC domain-containing protein [uncultured Ruegeria sp.]|uniref:SRPBCC family protein n=1 Tax=uncultured Ruegeria sp. TaxID=259304 RepID=UPI0026034BAA|nr:SRPBCC domain-containing protein [uncultured Ruegeria sp.]